MLALILAALFAPTPSPTLSPLPVAQVNWYAVEGARASGLDTALIRSVIDNESAGDPHAVSKAGAVGLMQLEADTANACGVSNRFDALTNAICGSKTLSYLIHDLGIERGIAAYNFGYGNVTNTPQTSWPQETKNYVASVISEYDALQHDGSLAAVAPTPAPSSTPTPSPCPDQGVQPFMVAAQVSDSFVTANAINHGDTGVRIFGRGSAIGYVADSLLGDWLFHRFARHASCGLRTGFDLLFTGAAINNAASTEFPK